MINILANHYNIHEKWCFDALKTYISNESKVVILALSFSEDNIGNDDMWQQAYHINSGKYYSGIVEPLKEFGVKESNITWVNYYTDSKESAIDKIKSADVLYLTGGLPDKMMDRLKLMDLVDVMKRHDGIVLGFSAGAMVQLNHYHISPDNDYPEFKYENGLGLLDNMYLEVHFNHDKDQMKSIEKVIHEKMKPVYAIEENGIIIINEGNIKTIGQVHLYQI